MKVLTPSVLAGDRNPGGADTQVQYNSSGSLAGSADLTWDDTAKELGVGGDINLDDGGTYATTLQLITPTANRTISFPDATGTVGLVGGSSGQLIYNAAGAYAGAPSTSVGATGNITLSLAGAASTPPVSLTGSWFSGGTSTTTKPQLLIEPTGTTSTAWSTGGTGLGVNAPSGFGGNLLDLQVNGSSKLYISNNGNIAVPSGSQSAPSLTFTGDTNTGIYSPGADQVALSVNGSEGVRLTTTGLGIGTTSPNSSCKLSVSKGGAEGIELRPGTATAGQGDILFYNRSTSSYLQANYIANIHTWTGPSGERARIDSSGRLLVGTSSSSSLSKLVVGGGAGTSACRMTLAFGVSTPNSGDTLGAYDIADSGQVTSARIEGQRDGGTWTSGVSQPTRLVFSVTADGAASPTEALRISSNRAITVSDGGHIVLGTTTGTKIGTATTQKIGFYNATPVVQPTAVADITTTATSGSLPTPDGTVTIADATTPTVTELLEYCVELEAKLEAALGHLRTLGLIAT